MTGPKKNGAASPALSLERSWQPACSESYGCSHDRRDGHSRSWELSPLDYWKDSIEILESQPELWWPTDEAKAFLATPPVETPEPLRAALSEIASLEPPNAAKGIAARALCAEKANGCARGGCHVVVSDGESLCPAHR